MTNNRFTVVPIYRNTGKCYDILYDYRLWDKNGNTIVDEFGLPIIDSTIMLKPQGPTITAFGAPLDLAIKLNCDKCEELNESDALYVSMVNEYAKLTYVERVKLFLNI